MFMGIIITIAVVMWIVSGLYPPFLKWLKRKYRRLAENRHAKIFENHYLESKAFYMYRFRAVPCMTFIDDIDVSKSFEHIQKKYAHRIIDTYQACFFNRQVEKHQFSKTLFVLDNKMIIELASNYARIFYPNNLYHVADKLVTALNDYKLPEKKEDFEINIITFSNNSLDLKSLDIKPTVLDLGLYYNDDFKDVDTIIKNRLSQQNDKGIVLLHGLPGTGKTTYLRHLIGELKKKVLFVSPSVAGNLMNPEFIDLLIENPNSILIIEDAENIMMDRKHNNDSSVSNLLNLSDGLLSDCLSVQIICTFNSSLHLIDSALMRKGRLIAKYEFGKLSTEKSQSLSKQLGFDSVITQPMTIAEIANQHEKQYEAKRVQVLGFRREETVMN
jgi:hypothetical protein